MKTTAEIFRRRRRELEMSTTKLAELTGVSQTFANSVELGKKAPGSSYMEKAIEVLKLSEEEAEQVREYEEFRKLSDKMKRKIELLERAAEQRGNAKSTNRREIEIKVFGLASAGTGVFEEGEYQLKHISIPNGLNISNDDFALKIKGDSMEPVFCDDDLVLVDCSMCDGWTLLNKKIVAVSINGEKFVKKVMFNNYKLEFHSLNPFYPPIIANESDQIKCHGVVTALLFRKL